jgi:hypothetical protein
LWIDENSAPKSKRSLPEFGKSPRQMMQTLGTDQPGSCPPRLWLILAGKRIEELKAQGVNVAITGCPLREKLSTSASGGVVPHVKRPGIGEVSAQERGWRGIC